MPVTITLGVDGESPLVPPGVQYYSQQWPWTYMATKAPAIEGEGKSLPLWLLVKTLGVDKPATAVIRNGYQLVSTTISETPTYVTRPDADAVLLGVLAWSLKPLCPEMMDRTITAFHMAKNWFDEHLTTGGSIGAFAWFNDTRANYIELLKEGL